MAKRSFPFIVKIITATSFWNILKPLFCPDEEFLGKVYLYYCLLFVLSFILIFPLFLILILLKSNSWLVALSTGMGVYCFSQLFLPFEIESRKKLNPNWQYIFCPNHFSYLISPPWYSTRTTPSSWEGMIWSAYPYSVSCTGTCTLPLIARSWKPLRYLLKSGEAIDQAKVLSSSEGGIVSTDFPRMARFKDGAFRLASGETNTHCAGNHCHQLIILPNELTKLTRIPIRMIFHETDWTRCSALDSSDTKRRSLS